MNSYDIKSKPNTMHLTLSISDEGDMTVSKGWFFTDDMPEDVVGKAQMIMDGIILMLEFDAEELMKKAAYGMMYLDMKDQERIVLEAEEAPAGENIVSLARMKLQ